MKKIYTTPKMPAVSNFKNSCSPYGFSFIKTLSLVSVAVFLSNASPVSACDLWGNVETYFGAGTNIRKSIAPTYIIDGSVYRDVGSAFLGVDRKFKSLKNAFDTAFIGWGTWKQQVDKKFEQILSDQLVKQDFGGTITIGANKGGYVVDIANNSREARVLTGVRNAVLDPTSSQAVNGSQLYKLGIGVAKSFGGGARYDQNGNWIAPTFMVKAFDKNGNEVDKSYNSVAEAFTGVSDSFANLDKKIENVVTNVAGDSLVKQDFGGTITIGANKDGYVVDIANNSREARVLTGVRNAVLEPTSSQAVNGSQLYKLGIGVAKSFGGGAGYDKNGNWIAPTFMVKAFDKNGNEVDKSYNSVAAAFTGVSDSFANLDKKIENVVTNVAGDSLVKQDNTGLITIGGKVSGTKVSIANIDNAVRILTGVNAGSITATSTDAINGSQLYSMSNLVAGYFSRDAGYDADGKWSAPTFTVKVFDEDGHGAETHYENVADALTGVNTSFTNLDKKIENVVTNVAGDSLVKQDDTGLITIGGKVSGTKVSIANIDNAVRILTGVNAGSITATSTDAINGSQLYSMSNLVAGYFSRDAGYDADGKWSAPTFTVKVFDEDGHGAETHYENVADALTGVNTSFTNLDKKIENVVTNVAGDSLVKQDDTGLITIGGKVSGTKVSIANIDNAVRILTGVNAGSITATSTDAINGSQLYSMSNVVAGYFGGGAEYKDGKWSAPTFTVKVFDKDGSGAEEEYKNVADAFTGVNTSFENLDKKIENVATNVAGNSLVKQDDTGLIKIGGEVSGTRVSIVNKTNAPRVLTGVNAGSITATSTDAINGSQLYSMSNLVAGYFSRDAGYDADGKWNAPTFTVKVFDKNGSETETHYANVADAFTGVNTSFENLDKKIENVATNVAGNSLVKQEKATGLITIGGEVNGTRVSIANRANAPRVLSGVNAGSITAISTDAINGSQFYSMSNEVASYFSRDAGYDKDGHWIAPIFTVQVLKKDGNETERHYENVADALSDIGSSFTTLNQKIKNVTNDGLVKQNSTGLITIGASRGGDRIDIANDMDTPRVLSGVKGGAFTKTSTEAVNGSQLYLLSQAFASYFGGGAGYDNEGQWSGPTFTIKAYDMDGNETEHKYTNVADAFAGVNSVFKSLNQQIIDVKDGIDLGEKPKGSQKSDDANDIITEGFPFMRMVPMARMLPRALDEMEGEDEDNGTTTTVGAKSTSKKLSIINSKGETRTLLGVAAGKLSADSTDAVNGSQLYSLGTEIAKSFGGEAGYNEKGEWKAPSFIVSQFKDGHLSEESYNNVASAFAGMNKTLSIIDDRISKVEQKANSNGASNGFPWNEKEGAYDASHNGAPSKITHVADGNISEGSKDVVNGGQLWDTNNKVKDVADKVTEVEKKVDVAVSYDVDKNGKKTNSINLVGGNESEPVLINNVKDGDISEDSKQAVNGGQLYNYTNEQMKTVLQKAQGYTDEKVSNLINNSVNEAKSYTNMKFEALNYNIENVRKEARQAAAIGLAVSNLRYFDDPGSLSVSFGSGLWRGQSAFAIGAGYTSEDGKIRSNLSATSAGGHWGVGGGITLKLK
ncbi:YadA-like family protein [Bartonella mastomydis]|uniref:YadA-like family protein n=1 Tax=Bartonella mastomydis TaxID=1820002 RepID=UPI0015D5BF36|nr:YadA-like family protein [Bartonella mastomydis]